MSELARGGGAPLQEKSQSTMHIWFVCLLCFIALPAVLVLAIKYLFGF